MQPGFLTRRSALACYPRMGARGEKRRNKDRRAPPSTLNRSFRRRPESKKINDLDTGQCRCDD